MDEPVSHESGERTRLAGTIRLRSNASTWLRRVGRAIYLTSLPSTCTIELLRQLTTLGKGKGKMCPEILPNGLAAQGDNNAANVLLAASSQQRILRTRKFGLGGCVSQSDEVCGFTPLVAKHNDRQDTHGYLPSWSGPTPF